MNKIHKQQSNSATFAKDRLIMTIASDRICDDPERALRWSAKMRDELLSEVRRILADNTLP